MATSITNTSVTTDNLTVDTNVLHVDSTNNRVGINTTDGPEALNISGNGNLRFQTTNTVRIEYLNTIGAYALGTSGGAAIGFNRPATGDDEIFFETHNGGVSHAERMRINKDGYVTTPFQPYFEACFSTSGWTNYATGGTWVKMEMDATITNVGGHYDTTNTRFVAPVAGKYFMSASVFLNVTWNSSTPYLSYLGFYKNNAFFSHFGQDVQSTEHIRHGIIMPLAANDYVDVRIQQAQTPATNQYYKLANGRNYTYFHGMLIG
tara:strand:+ start:10526 stop:11314 length:789 start_codon:yes stop_codon:yes gene_type:complete